MVYIENPIDSTKKLFDLLRESGKIAEYKVSIHKCNIFLYISMEISETKTREKIPFTLATRKIKYLRINLTKEVKNLYLKIYKTLKKEIMEKPWLVRPGGLCTGR